MASETDIYKRVESTPASITTKKTTPDKIMFISCRRRKSKTKSQMEALPIAITGAEKENMEPESESVIIIPGPPPTEEQVLSQVMSKARQNRLKILK